MELVPGVVVSAHVFRLARRDGFASGIPDWPPEHFDDPYRCAQTPVVHPRLMQYPHADAYPFACSLTPIATTLMTATTNLEIDHVKDKLKEAINSLTKVANGVDKAISDITWAVRTKESRKQRAEAAALREQEKSARMKAKNEQKKEQEANKLEAARQKLAMVSSTPAATSIHDVSPVEFAKAVSVYELREDSDDFKPDPLVPFLAVNMQRYHKQMMGNVGALEGFDMFKRDFPESPSIKRRGRASRGMPLELGLAMKQQAFAMLQWGREVPGQIDFARGSSWYATSATMRWLGTDYMALPTLRFQISGQRRVLCMPLASAVEFLSNAFPDTPAPESLDAMLKNLEACADVDLLRAHMSRAFTCVVPENSFFYLPSGYLIAETGANNTPSVGVRMTVFLSSAVAGVQSVAEYMKSHGGHDNLAKLELYIAASLANDDAPKAADETEEPPAKKPKGAAKSQITKPAGKSPSRTSS